MDASLNLSKSSPSCNYWSKIQRDGCQKETSYAVAARYSKVIDQENEPPPEAHTHDTDVDLANLYYEPFLLSISMSWSAGISTLSEVVTTLHPVVWILARV